MPNSEKDFREGNETRIFLETILGADAGEFMSRASEFMHLLFEENCKYNLTAIRTEEDFWVKHICDSISILKFFPELFKPGLRIGDVGAGAGFPSFPLALALPQAELFAIDSSRKKTAFIEIAASKLKTPNLRIVNARTVELSRTDQWKGFFDIIVARAVGTASKIVTESSRMLKMSGTFILYKTPDAAAAEICELRKKTGKTFNWTSTPVFYLPSGAGRRTFIHGYDKSASVSGIAEKTKQAFWGVYDVNGKGN